MSLPIKETSILSRGSHEGFEWFTARYALHYRAGYVRVSEGHPWYRKTESDVQPTPEIHGGLTFAERCGNGWWLGFDCGHDCDLEDPALLPPGVTPMEPSTWFASVRSEQYVEAECRSLCEQAAAAEIRSQEPTE